LDSLRPSPSPAVSSEPVVHRPAWSSFGRRAKRTLIPLALLLALVTGRVGPSTLIVLAVGVAILAPALIVFFRTATVTVTADRLTYRRLGRESTVLLDGTQRGIHCRLKQGLEELEYVGVRDSSGSLIGLTEAYFAPEALADVARRVGADPSALERTLTGPQAEAMMPGTLTFTLRRPAVTALLVLAVTTIVVTPLVLATAA
jgi:hypothetical protein